MKIGIVGNTVVDLFSAFVDVFPDEGDTEKIKKFEMVCGGNGCSTAISLAKLGLDPLFYSAVGDDFIGEYVLRELKNTHKVNTDCISIIKKVKTGVTNLFISSNKQLRSYQYLGANEYLDLGTHIDINKLCECDLVVITGFLYLTKLLKKLDGILYALKKNGVITVCDVPTYFKNTENISYCLSIMKFIDYFIPNNIEAMYITKKSSPIEQVKVLKEAGTKNVIIKCGEKGCYCEDFKGNNYILPPFPINVVDTTGAGDAFVSGFIFGLSKGLDFSNCCLSGSLVARDAISCFNATAGVKTGLNYDMELKSMNILS